ncbi:hypothetical protein [Cellulomonas sp. URHB0016]
MSLSVQGITFDTVDARALGAGWSAQLDGELHDPIVTSPRYRDRP